jgi:predicted lipoprotein with Yx(FWY)xxD motif
MKNRVLVTFAPAAAAVAIAGCGGGGAQSYGSAPAAPASGSAPAAPSGTSVLLSRAGFLTDGSGRTLYLFVADKATASTCYSTCASAWPPVTTSGVVKAGPSVVASRLGTSKRTDGTTEVTYDGHPLYYYAGDSKPGDMTGQALDQFGAKWFLVGRSGRATT